MSGFRTFVDAAAAVLIRDARLYVSYRTRFITHMLSPFFTLVLFYYVSRLVTVDAFPSPDTYFAFVVVGLVVLQVITAGLISLPSSLRHELVAATFERVVLSPFGAVCFVPAMLIFPLVLAFLQGLATLAMAVVVFDMPVDWSSAPLAIPVVLVSALAFVPFALLIASAVLTIKQALAGTGIVLTGISLVSGFFFPVELLPGWIEWASEVQPFTPALAVLRDLLAGLPAETTLWEALAKLAVSIGVLLPLSLWTLGASIRIAQRRGTIIEY